MCFLYWHKVEIGGTLEVKEVEQDFLRRNSKVSALGPYLYTRFPGDWHLIIHFDGLFAEIAHGLYINVTNSWKLPSED